MVRMTVVPARPRYTPAVPFHLLTPGEKAKVVNRALTQLVSFRPPPKSSRDFKKTLDADMAKVAIEFGLPFKEVENLYGLRRQAVAGALPRLKQLFAA